VSKAQPPSPNGLTIAVPKGALFHDSAERLRAAGIDVPNDVGRKLTVRTSDGTTLLFLRPTDVPAYVEFGSADCGIVGKDVLWETDRSVSELADLGFGYCRLCVAARRLDRYHEGAPFPTFLRVATKFQRSAEAYFADRDVPVEIIPLHGSVELSPLVGLADLIVDLVGREIAATRLKCATLGLQTAKDATRRLRAQRILGKAEVDRLAAEGRHFMASDDVLN